MNEQRALVLCPSGGLGGGIERFCDAVTDALARRGVQHVRLDLIAPDQPSGRLRRQFAMRRRASSFVRESNRPVRLVVMHRSLLPLAVSLARSSDRITGVTIVLFGIDIWGGRIKPEFALLRYPSVRTVAISAFSAGAIANRAKSTILHPNISGDWYHQLISAKRQAHMSSGDTLNVITAFRLSQWRSKGLPTLVEACEHLGVQYSLTVCGSGRPEQDLSDFTDRYPSVSLRPDLSDEELARAMAEADVFVLATRLTMGKHPSGEGFGLVITEAQLAGTAVIAPAHGGGHDTHLEGLTGHSPVDESPEALGAVLRKYLDPEYRSRLAAAGHDTAVAYFDPERQAERVVSRLL